jgi:TolB-like protein/class 3 adenylate cyclase
MIVMRKLAAILVADIVGFSRLAGADEDRVLARLRALRSDLIDPVISVHNGRIVKRTGDGVLVEFRSVVDAVRCGIELQNGLIERNAGVPTDRRIELRVGIHLGDVVEETDGDLMGDGVNIAARLEGIAKPGAIALSEDAYRQVRGRLDVSVSDLGEQELKNIAEPIRVYSLEVGRPVEAKPPPLESPPQAVGPPRCSIVVLPFATLGGGPEQENFVDAVTDSLTTDLSQMSNTVVVARNTAFTYRGKTVDARQVGRDLNVRYIFEGSIQRGANRMRINAQLIDATSGNHLWADRFDKPMADLFDMQDEIVSYIANQLRGELIVAEARRAEQEPHPDSLDYYFRGVATFNKGGLDKLAEARALFQKSVELDPTNVDSIVGEARVDVLCALYGYGDRAKSLAAAEAAVLRGLSLQPRNHWAHLWLGFIQIQTNRARRAIGEFERALTLNRNMGVAHAWIGLAKITLGRAEEAAAHVAEAFRIAPVDGAGFLWRSIEGQAKLCLGEDEEAVDLFRQSLDASRNYLLNHFYLAAALERLGRHGEAEAEARAGLAAAPQFSLSRFREAAESDNVVYLAQREQMIEAMRAAGVPERAPAPVAAADSLVVLPNA